jgi:hypothetical protein
MALHRARKVAELDSVRVWKVCQSCDSTMSSRIEMEFNTLEVVIAAAVVVVEFQLVVRQKFVFFSYFMRGLQSEEQSWPTETKDR